MSWRKLQPPLFFLIVAAAWLGTNLFPAEGWALGGADMRGLFYPWWEFVRNSLFKSQIPFWDPLHFGGSPFLHNPQIAFFYPPSWIVFALPINVGISFYYLFHLTLAGWGMARLTADLSCRHADQQPVLFGMSLGSLAAGLSFMLGGFFATRMFAGHVGFLATHIWLPWILVATFRGVAGKSWRQMAPAALCFGLAILAGHTTTLLYLGLIWGLFALWTAWNSRNRPLGFALLFVAGSAVMAILLSAVQLLPTLQLITRSGRLSQGGYEFATRFSLPWRQLVTLIIPEAFGEPTHIGYWGAENFEELTAYPGIFGMAAFVATIVWLARDRSNRWQLFFCLLSLFGVLTAVGSDGFLYRWLYVVFPPFRVMRAPGRALFFVAFSAPVLLGLLISELFNRPFWGKQRVRQALIGSTALYVVTLAGLWVRWSAADTAETLGRSWHQLENAALTGAILLAGLGLVRWLIADPQRSRWGSIGALGLLLLLGGDLANFGRKLIRTEPMTPATLWLEAASVNGIADGRILPWGVNIFEQNGAGQLGLNSIFGYNTLENGAITRLAASVPDPRSKAYDVLGVSHVVAEVGLEQFADGERGLRLVQQVNGTRVYTRPTALPYARLVGRYEVIDSADRQFERLHGDGFDPAEVVLLEQPPACDLPSDQINVGSVEIVERRGGILRVVSKASQAALLVVAETDFPGWRVTIDGDPQAVERAYTAVQAVCVPAGEHEVEFRFRPLIFGWGGAISGFGILLLLWLWFSGTKKRPGL